MAKFTAEQIIKIIEERPEGVSVKDYCAQASIHPRLYYYHRSKLASKQNDGGQIKSGRVKVSKNTLGGYSIKNKK